MRIFFITFGDLRFEFIAYNLAKLLTDNFNCEIIIYGHAPLTYPRFAQYTERIKLVSCPDIRNMSKRIPKIIKVIIGYFRFISIGLQTAVRFRPNIVLCTNYDSLLLAKLIAFIYNAKFIYYCTEHTERVDFLKIRSLRQLLKWLEKFVITSKDIIVAVEPWRAQQLQLQIRREVIVIRNTPLFESNNHFLPLKKQNKNALLNFVYAGKIVESTGIIEFIEALSFFPPNQVAFHIYGRIEDNLKEKFRKVIHKAVTKGILVNYYGIIEYKLLSHELQKYDVGICFYKGSNMNEIYCAPAKLFEYCKAGLVLLVSKNLGIYNALGERDFVFYVEEITPEAVIQVIKRIIQKNEHLWKLKMQSYNTYAYKFNYNLEFENLLKELKRRKWM